MPRCDKLIRVRLTYEKGSALKYTGHLDLHKVWERTFRRAQLPLAYSQGFHPQPRIQQACPLPLGFNSLCEVVDFWLKEDLELDNVISLLTPVLHPGIKIVKGELVSLSELPSQATVSSSDYLVRLASSTDTVMISNKIDALTASMTLIRERRGKSYDLRQLILSIRMINTPGAAIEMRLSMLPGATGRPEEVLSALDIDPNSVEIVRTALLFDAKP